MKRFEVWLAESGIGVAVKRFPEGTRTAVDAAKAVGCDVEQIVKSLVFVAGGGGGGGAVWGGRRAGGGPGRGWEPSGREQAGRCRRRAGDQGGCANRASGNRLRHRRRTAFWLCHGCAGVHGSRP